MIKEGVLIRRKLDCLNLTWRNVCAIHGVAPDAPFIAGICLESSIERFEDIWFKGRFEVAKQPPSKIEDFL